MRHHQFWPPHIAIPIPSAPRALAVTRCVTKQIDTRCNCSLFALVRGPRVCRSARRFRFRFLFWLWLLLSCLSFFTSQIHHVLASSRNLAETPVDTCIHACAKASNLLLRPSPSHFASPIASRVCSKRAEFSVPRGCFRIRVFEAKGRGDRTYLIAKLGQLVESVCACGSCRSNLRGGAPNS